MDSVYINIKVEEVMKDFGLMICKMVMGLKNGLMVLYMKVNSRMG
jgi:hypothetical protein